MLIDWLRREPFGSEWRRFLGAAVIAKLVISVVCISLALMVTPIAEVEGIREVLDTIMRRPDLLLWVVMAEELLFRLPLVFFLAIWKVGRVTLVAAVVLSLIFGEMHGPWHALVQGPGGMVMCVAFIKCGGARGGWGYAKGYASAVAVHLCFNSIFLVPMLISHALGFSPSH